MMHRDQEPCTNAIRSSYSPPHYSSCIPIECYGSNLVGIRNGAGTMTYLRHASVILTLAVGMIFSGLSEASAVLTFLVEA